MNRFEIRALKKTLDKQFAQAYYDALNEGTGGVSFTDLSGCKVTVANKTRTVIKQKYEK